MQVSTWMTPRPFCVASEDRLDWVAALMRAHGVHRVPVVDRAGRLCGIVTEHDLRVHQQYPSLAAHDAMSEPPIAVRADDSVERAAEVLLERRIGGVPVVDRERRVVGMLTTSDVLCALLDGGEAKAA